MHPRLSLDSMRPAVRLLALGLVACLLLPRPALSWQTAHGAPDNSGAVDVATLPAKEPLPNAPRLGGIAPGAGPVIAGDGTVYVVNGRGRLMSFKPDGTPGWSRDIAGGQGVLASPALGSDGSIYIVGSATIRDHATNPPTTRQVAELHKFNSGGAYLWHVPLPGEAGGLTASAPPNIWRGPNGDIIFVPTVRKFAGFQARLTAFSETGAVVADKVVTNFVPETTGGGGKWYHAFAFLNLCFWIDVCDFQPAEGTGYDPNESLPERMLAALPAAAIHSPPGSGTPLVIVSDAFQDLVGYAFTGGSFEERFRIRDDKRYLVSTPAAWPDGHAMIATGGHGTKSEVMFAGFGFSTIRADAPLAWAAPTALGNSRFALVQRYGGLTILRGAAVESSFRLRGHSIASAAASRNHLFVSTVSALLTFDKATLGGVAGYAWQRGGASPVAIGPQGNVYAIADDRLYVFPATAITTQTTPDAPSPPQSAQTYKPPLTANGNRLYACLALDGDDCGKGDAREIAAAFCTKQGYARADDLKTDNKKTKAETLDGQFCTKKKCKVFERITCSM